MRAPGVQWCVRNWEQMVARVERRMGVGRGRERPSQPKPAVRNSVAHQVILGLAEEQGQSGWLRH
jgi:hypothetical protein